MPHLFVVLDWFAYFYYHRPRAHFLKQCDHNELMKYPDGKPALEWFPKLVNRQQYGLLLFAETTLQSMFLKTCPLDQFCLAVVILLGYIVLQVSARLMLES